MTHPTNYGESIATSMETESTIVALGAFAASQENPIAIPRGNSCPMICYLDMVRARRATLDAHCRIMKGGPTGQGGTVAEICGNFGVSTTAIGVRKWRRAE